MHRLDVIFFLSVVFYAFWIVQTKGGENDYSTRENSIL